MTRKTTHRCPLALLVAAVAMSVGASASAQVAVETGLNDLIKRLGSGNQPTGAGIGVGQVEADGDGVQGAPFSSYPDTTLSEFAGKTFTPMSGATGVSGHATTVGQNCYSIVNSIAPGITSIFMYEANSWLTSGFLRASLGGLPLTPPSGVRIFNNSWIGDATTFNNEILRRADFAADRSDAQEVLIVNGTNNGGSNQPLMAFMFNGLAVGRSGGGHASGLVPATVDGPGRQVPQIVAPGSATSFATPVVSAAAALMYQVAQTGPGLSSNSNARRSETIKAVLLGGANHRAGWTNNPSTSGANRGVTTTPMSPTWGVDLVNVDRSHLILTGLEQNGSASVPSSSTINAAGWDFANMAANTTQYYRFSLSQPADKLAVIATWHRTITSNFTLAVLPANFDLELKRIDGAGQAVSLVGNAGLPYFGGGNVVSQSTVENIEHLYVTNLAAGNYVIELRRLNDGIAGSRDVALTWIMPNTLNPADINGDGDVDIDDLLAVISAWGNCPASGPCPADVVDDGVVNIDDLLFVISNWGA